MSINHKGVAQSVIDKLQALAHQKTNTAQSNPPQNTQNNNNTPAASRFQPRNNNQNNGNGGSLLNRVNNGNQPLNWSFIPVNTTVVRFDLRGLGDPFYRLLSHPMNADFGDPLKFSEVVEEGGETSLALESILEENWVQYEFTGAMLIYPWNQNVWKSVARPYPIPIIPNNNNAEATETKPDQNLPEPSVTCLRSIDLSLVLNVLARARSQIVLSNAPLILNRQYLMRSLVSDDPRLIDLVRATGFMGEAL